MKKLHEAINLNTAILTEVVRNFRVTMGGKYGKISSDNQDAMTMLRAIMYDIESINENLKRANSQYRTANNTVRIGTIYRLNDKYKDSFTHAIISYDVQAQETIVELFSNWNSSYNETKRIKYSEPLEVAKEYQA
ncbi:MAG TPA: hypothetical protein DHU59_13485 [Clostridiales bacterium]|nr:hypothetical protein [Clostridiales bacterium]